MSHHGVRSADCPLGWMENGSLFPDTTFIQLGLGLIDFLSFFRVFLQIANSKKRATRLETRLK